MAHHRAIVGQRQRCPVGSWVQSEFRAPWRGVVVELTPRDDTYDLARVRVQLDRRGNPVRKPWIATLSAYWLKPAGS